MGGPIGYNGGPPEGSHLTGRKDIAGEAAIEFPINRAKLGTFDFPENARMIVGHLPNQLLWADAGNLDFPDITAHQARPHLSLRRRKR